MGCSDRSQAGAAARRQLDYSVCSNVNSAGDVSVNFQASVNLNDAFLEEKEELDNDIQRIIRILTKSSPLTIHPDVDDSEDTSPRRGTMARNSEELKQNVQVTFWPHFTPKTLDETFPGAQYGSEHQFTAEQIKTFEDGRQLCPHPVFLQKHHCFHCKTENEAEEFVRRQYLEDNTIKRKFHTVVGGLSHYGTGLRETALSQEGVSEMEPTCINLNGLFWFHCSNRSDQKTRYRIMDKGEHLEIVEEKDDIEPAKVKCLLKQHLGMAVHLPLRQGHLSHVEPHRDRLGQLAELS